MNKRKILHLCIMTVFILALGSCVSHRYSYREAGYEKSVVPGTVLNNFNLEEELENRIRTLDPESVAGRDVEETLSHAPAPRIMNIHGGIYPVHLLMESFSKFLIFMGYPENKIRNPGDGSYSRSCYESSAKLAGLLAWYYEKEGMRPMIIGHSQGGMQAVKVLYQLAGHFSGRIEVWNPLTDDGEKRFTIIDPLTGEERPVVGLEASYVSAVGAGGMTRFLPNQWSMINRLRHIPDSVEEFTGFYMGLDFFGGDLFGFGSANKYEPNGDAAVRNVRLPASYSHIIVPMTRHLAKTEDTRKWINKYVPSDEPEIDKEFESSSANILWAADVWHSIKKHWVLELQRLILAKRNLKK